MQRFSILGLRPRPSHGFAAGLYRYIRGWIRLQNTACYFLVAILVGFVMEPLDVEACTTAIVSARASADGRPMIWKQRDASDTHNCLVFNKGELYDFTAVVPFGKRDAVYGGINTAGFAVANNVSYNLREDTSDTYSRNGRIMCLALGSCRTVDEFGLLLSRYSDSLRTSSNFAVIDAYGGAAYFEAEDHGFTRYDVPAGGYLYRTNFSLSGKEGEGKGYARYSAMERIMENRPSGGYDAGFFLTAGRSFLGGITGKDALKGAGDFIYDHDFIPRPTSASSFVIEGVTASDRPDVGMIWFAPGYPPCSYAVAAWVAAGDRIPSCIGDSSPANIFARELMQRLHPLTWKGGEKYLDVRLLKTIAPSVRKAERTEFKAGRRLDRRFRKDGIDLDAVAAYNAAADERFEAFRKTINGE